MVQPLLYLLLVKYGELAKRLAEMGWHVLRQGGSHEMWTDGENSIAVPRHKEIKEFTAQGIIKKAGRLKK